MDYLKIIGILFGMVVVVDGVGRQQSENGVKEGDARVARTLRPEKGRL